MARRFEWCLLMVWGRRHTHIIHDLDFGLQPSGLGSVVVTYSTGSVCPLVHKLGI
jgi:hypothetical protein